MEHEDESAKKNTSLSELITSECQLLPKSYDALSDRFHSYFEFEIRYITYCGSTMEFYIRPLNSCIDDIDILAFRADALAFTEDFPVLPLDVSVLCDRIECFKIESCLKYPGFVRLRYLGSKNYNWKCRKYEFIPTTLINRYHKFDAVGEASLMNFDNNVRFGVQAHTVTGPAIKIQMYAQNALVDYVEGMWCPQWPQEAQRWPKRPRNYGWPTYATISEIVQNGCHIVHVQHRASRDDRAQWRLSFSVAEVILLQSWTSIQQMVYHLLRFFAKRELMQKDCPKEDEVLCTYHLKTLMLWTCEEMPPEWWNSSSIFGICCELLIKLLDWLKRRCCPNYFIPEANLLHDLVGSKMADKIERRLYMFCSPDTLCDWFECNYIRPIAQKIEDIRVVRSPFVGSTSPQIEFRDAARGLSLQYLFALGFTYCNQYTRTMINSEDLNISAMRSCLSFLRWTRKLAMLQESNMSLIPIPDDVGCFTYFDATLHILHTLHSLDCEKITWHSELFIKFIEGISLKHKIVLCYYHIYPTPFRAEGSQSQFLKAQNFLLNLTVSNSPLEFQLFSLLSKGFLRKALECDDSQSNIIASAALSYAAALHFATSESDIAIDLCSAVLMDQTTHTENETLNAGCLFFIDDVVRIVGFCLLCKKLNGKKMYTNKHIYLDLRLTPKVFAYYLVVASTTRISKQFQLSFALPTSEFPFDHFFFIMIKRKLCSPMKLSNCLNAVRHCVYRRTDLLTSKVALDENYFLVKDKLISILMEYALENMTLFFNVIRKDYDIHCNTVACYRALYLYKCHKYDDAINFCERILREPDLKGNFRKFAFMNVLLLPPLNIFFDRDLQSLLGFHTLCCYQTPLNDDMSNIDSIYSKPTFKIFFTREVCFGKQLISETLTRFSSIRCYYFIGRHFLARYLKLRCSVDRMHSIAESMDEFADTKLTFPFEHMIRRFIMQKLQSIQKTSKLER